MRSTLLRSNSATTAPIDSASLKTGMTTATPPVRGTLQAPAQSAAGASVGRLVRLERFAEAIVGRPGPDIAQRLLGGVAKRVIFVTALRERCDTARQSTAVGGEIHHGPRPPAQRPRRTRA